MLWEQSFLLYIQEHLRMTGLNGLMKAVSYMGTWGICFILLGVVLLLIPKTRKSGFIVLISLLVELLVVNIIIKPDIARIRPYDVMESLKVLVMKETDFSFPSGHTACAFAASAGLAMSLPKEKKRWALPAFLFAAVMAWSRLYVGVHYPTDVLAGAAIGVLCGVAGYYIVRGFGKVVSKVRKVS